jgi:tellurite resistance protein TehA-like permease
MKVLRIILGVIAGYALFVISAVLLFQLAEIDPHADPSVGIAVVTIGFGLIFSFLGGMLAQWIGGQGKLTVNYALAIILAGFAAFSLIKSSGNHYSQLAAIFLFAPASLLGGIYLRKKKG